MQLFWVSFSTYTFSMNNWAIVILNNKLRASHSEYTTCIKWVSEVVEREFFFSLVYANIKRNMIENIDFIGNYPHFLKLISI